MKRLCIALVSIVGSFAFVGTAGALGVNPPPAVPESGSTLIFLALGLIAVTVVSRKLAGRNRAKNP
jgi:hypothetical protein